MRDFKFQISDFGLFAVECGGTCFCTSWTRRSASLRKPVIPRCGDAEGSHEYSHSRQNAFSLTQILMRDPSLSSQLGMTEEMNPE